MHNTREETEKETKGLKEGGTVSGKEREEKERMALLVLEASFKRMVT